MKRLYTEEQIEEMRKRLYDRGTEVEKIVRHELSDTKVDVNRDWAVNQSSSRNVTDIRSAIAENNHDAPLISSEDLVIAAEEPKRRYRSFILGGSFLIFVLVALISSLFIYFGGNRFSGDKILVTIEGKPLIGGGEVMDLKIKVENKNDIPIDAATLIVKYPAGTRTTGDESKNVYEERIPLNELGVGSVQDIPLQVIVYGEENAEQKISATIEYRVNGSNGMFEKNAEPLAYRISSAPIALRVDSVEKVASGQLIDVVLTLASNASTPLHNVLVTASYPNGFAFESAEPEPSFSENVWKIDELLPEQSVEIKLKGVISGLMEEKIHINFAAGSASADNQFLVDAVLDEVRTDFQIEQPFIDVQIAINGDKDRSAVVSEGSESMVEVIVKNTLDETVYDMAIEVIPKGNALSEKSVVGETGFYDSNSGKIRWELTNNPTFDKILPGSTRSLKFNIKPNSERTTASYDLEVNVYARRVADSSALETLIGSNKAEAKYSSHLSLYSQAGRNTSRFTDSGPIPPRVGETTTYTVTLVAEAGANNINGAVLETGLPLYVDWLNEYEADGTVTYNSVSKRIEWNIGDIDLEQRKELSFQVSVKPSISQSNEIPQLLNKQTLKGSDGFTKEHLQDIASPVTTELSPEMGFTAGNGVVTN